MSIADIITAISTAFALLMAAIARYIRVRTNSQIASRDQMMREYGFIISELRETNTRQQVEIDKLRQDVKTAWDFQVRRAYAEAVQKGFIKPEDIPEEGKQQHDGGTDS